MKYLILITLLISLFLIPNSCKKEPICACSVEYPEDNLPWLKSYLSNETYANVYKLKIDSIEYIIYTRVPGLDAGGEYTGDNACYFLSPSWDSYYQNREFINILKDFNKKIEIKNYA